MNIDGLNRGFMRTFWISWWDPIDAKPGLPTDGIVTWVSGTRNVARAGMNYCQDSITAIVVAGDEAEAWGKADRYFPGAAAAERRFSDEVARGHRPGDRFPLTLDQRVMLNRAEAGFMPSETETVEIPPLALRLGDALREIEEFARRNAERARRAVDALDPGEDRLKAEARHHEAERFHLVVSDRVRAALR